MAEFYTPNWKRGELIRNKKTGKPYHVIHLFLNMGTMVVDAQENTSPNIPLIILPKDYQDYACDIEMECIEIQDEMIFKYTARML